MAIWDGLGSIYAYGTSVLMLRIPNNLVPLPGEWAISLNPFWSKVPSHPSFAIRNEFRGPYTVVQDEIVIAFYVLLDGSSNGLLSGSLFLGAQISFGFEDVNHLIFDLIFAWNVNC